MSSLIEEAIILHKKGKLTEAESLYKSILKDSKNNFEVTHLIGIVNIQLKKIYPFKFQRELMMAHK